MCAKIMVVDDDPHTRQLLRIIFTRVGYEVIEAQDGLDALGQLETNCCPHLVIFCLLYTSPSPRDRTRSRIPFSA